MKRILTLIAVTVLALAAAPALAQQAEIIGKRPSGGIFPVGTDAESSLRTTPKGAVGRAFGAPGDSVSHSCSNPETTVTLTGGAGKTWRVYCVGDAWIRVGATAAAAAPSTPLAGGSAEYWTFTASGSADPALHCFASSATTCIYTPMTDPL